MLDKHTVWKLHHYSAIQIFREINFGSLRVLNSSIFTVLVELNYDFGRFQPKICAKIQQNYSFGSSKLSK